METIKTAGGVVVGPNQKIAIVSQGGLSWSLPKGHIDPGETARQAAEREITEETGITKLHFIQELGIYERYRISLDGKDDTSEYKSIELFLYTTPEETLAPQDPANPEAAWVSLDEVATRLTHHKDIAYFGEIKPVIQTFINSLSE